jgi:hypothetical protein
MRSSSITFVVLCGASVLACSADAENTKSQAPVAGASNGSTGTSSGSSAGTSSVAAGGTASVTAGTSSTSAGTSSGAGTSNGGSVASGGTGTQTPLLLPFFVNAPGNFVKSGFMGDAMMTVTAAPSMMSPDGTCGGKRAPGKGGGDCDTFTVDASKAATPTWQGVFYQFPANNWGTFPGRTIASGAKAVKFQARASRSVAVMFQVGMCDPMDATKCVDGFYAYPDDADDTGKVTVGTEWTELSVSLSGKDYSKGVHGAFSWAISNDDLLGDSSALTLNLDSITWE